MTPIDPSQPSHFPALLDDARAADRLPWQPFREGVEIAWLYRQPDGGPAAAFLRYQPGASVPKHRHPRAEHILILAGSQSDEHGLYRAGALVSNRPGSSHDVTSAEGCLALLIWESQPEMLG